MKIVFATGIAGSGKPEYLRAFQDLCKKNKKRCQIISVGQLIFQIAEEMGLKIKEEKLLNLPQSTLRTLLSYAFERLPRIFDPLSDVIVISTHASYWWRNAPGHAFDISYLHKIKPDIYVTLVNSPLTIKANIEAEPKWGRDIISLEEILIWTEVEIYTTEILATLQKRPYYLMHFSHQVENLYRLIFENVKKFYVSYPMTFATGKDLKKIEKFIDQLRKYAIVFEPLLEGDLEKLKSAKLVKILRNQVVRRDYRLIDQSDGIIIYFPKIIASPGVENERAYAHQANKEVWIIYPSKRKSPFISYYADRFFESPEEVIKALSSKARIETRIHAD